MLAGLRRSFATGFFVTVPIVISLATIYWIFSVVDGVMARSAVSPALRHKLGRK